ncbi:MAG: glycolate oxidase subunit GlcD, partial [Archaeoglobi archaeon]|nr:glycolate oxidase subunit GlcD [Candidatus Mnemosynella sp.]
EDVSVPVPKIPDALVEIQKIPERVNNLVSLGIFGHAGDGNLHPTFQFDERDPEQREAFFKALDIMYREIAIPMGGTVTGEHGIGLIRAKYLVDEYGEEVVELMKGIKKLFDPNNIMNPDKGKPWGFVEV